MIEKDPIGNDLRKELRERPIGEGTTCIFCPESDPLAIEWHHVPGRAHSEDALVPVCKNCHAKCTEGQRLVGVDLKPAPSIVETVLNSLRSLGEFFLRLGKQFLKWAEDLSQWLQSLSLFLPNWREV